MLNILSSCPLLLRFSSLVNNFEAGSGKRSSRYLLWRIKKISDKKNVVFIFLAAFYTLVLLSSLLYYISIAMQRVAKRYRGGAF